MSSDKRRRTRVQGGWASGPGVKHGTNLPRAERVACVATTQAWLGKNADAQPNGRKFLFQQPEDIKEKPTEKVIEKAGVYNVSTEPGGVARIRLFPGFVDSEECEEMFDQLFHELPWKQRSDVKKNGATYIQPRLTAWFGDLPYSYSGVTLQPNRNWTPLLQELKSRLEENTGITFNSLLANLYRDGHDSVDWHSDDEKSLGPQPTVASLSFGSTRSFELRKKPTGEDKSDYTYMEHIKMPLTAGTLLIMEGALQDDWQHRVPKEYHDRGPRINLTFRVIFPEP